MRVFVRLLPVLALFAPLHAEESEQVYVMEAHVAITATALIDGPETLSIRADEETVRARRVSMRMTNTDVLDALVDADVIPERRGWQIIALWARWSGEGESYRLFARHHLNRSDLRPIPQEILSFEFLDSIKARRLMLDTDDTIRSGREEFWVHARLSLPATDDARGVALGIATGAGTHTRFAEIVGTRFAPMAMSFRGVGAWEQGTEEGEDGILQARLNFGASRAVAVPASLIPTGPDDDGPGFSGSGTLVVGGGGTILSGGVLAMGNQVLVMPGATLSTGNLQITIGSQMTFAFTFFDTLDLNNLPPGFLLADGVLTFTAEP